MKKIISEYIEEYRKNGGYIKTLRQHMGHAPILTIGVGVIRREAREEAGIELGQLVLLAICNGKDRFIEYPNGDIVYSTSIVFKTTSYEGEIVNDESEVLEHRFFGRENLPENINEFDKIFLEIWMTDSEQVTIYSGR